MKGFVGWNPWHGCQKLSPGCANCYVYRGDERRGRDASHVTRNDAFDLPIRKKRDGSWKIPSGSIVATCFSSDFFLEDADVWRAEAWAMIRERSDLIFFFITKRIDRFEVCLPDDWGDGYDNVSIGCTVENQHYADYRLPIFRSLPVKRRTIICEPLLEAIDLSRYLDGSFVQVVAGGESGPLARPCYFEWIESIHRQCVASGVSFWFKQTGARFIKDDKLYNINRRFQHSQARKAGLNIDVKMF